MHEPPDDSGTNRLRRRLVGVLCAVLIVGIGWLVATRSGPRGLRWTQSTGWWCEPGTSAANITPATMGAALCSGVEASLEPADSSLELLVLQYPHTRPDGKVMQVQIFKVSGGDGSLFGSVQELYQGVPRVLCDLDAQQAAYFRANGLPASLEAAMVKAFSGSQNGWDASKPPPPDIRIDPVLHIPNP